MLISNPDTYSRSILLLVTIVTAFHALPAGAIEGGYTSFEILINDTTLGGALDAGDGFGSAAANLGDLDGNGVADIAVAARADDDTGANYGAVYILYLASDGSLAQPAVKLTIPGVQQFAEDGLAGLGDYDGDGNYEIAVGADFYPSGANNGGKVTIVDIDPLTGAYQSHWEMRSGVPANFTTLGSNDRFGFGVENLGDWNGDGAPELGVGAIGNGASNNGAVYILFLKPPTLAGTNATGIETYTKLSESTGNLGITFDTNDDYFGTDLDKLPDLDGNGAVEIAVGASSRDPGGAVFVLFMDAACSDPLPATPPIPNTACQVSSTNEIGGQSGLPPTLHSGDRFGISLAWLEDQGGFREDLLIVGADFEDGGGTDSGAFWMLTLDASGAASSSRIVEKDSLDLVGLANGDLFGHAIAPLGDLDGDGSIDLVVGAFQDDDGGSNAGGAWLVGLSPCSIVVTNPVAYHAPTDQGERVCPPPPIDAQSLPQTLYLYVDAGPVSTLNPADVCKPDLGEGDEMCGLELKFELSGGLEITSFTPADSAPPANPSLGILAGARNSAPAPGATELSVAWVPSTGVKGPLKVGELVVDIPGANTGAQIALGAGSAGVSASLEFQAMPSNVIAVPEPGVRVTLLAMIGLLAALARRRARLSNAVANLVLLVAVAMLAVANPVPATAGTSVKGQTTFTYNCPGVECQLQGGAAIGDIDGDGTVDLVMGYGQTEAEQKLRTVFLDDSGGVLGTALVAVDNVIDNDGASNAANGLGLAIEALGDRNDDGVPDLVVGSADASPYTGEVTIVYLDDNGTEQSFHRIADGSTGFTGTLDAGDRFGRGIGVADFNGDGIEDLAVGAPRDDDAGTDAGAVWILLLDANEWVTGHVKITEGAVGFAGVIDPSDFFGGDVTSVGDLDGNGTPDIAVGASGDDAGAGNGGAIWILYLDEVLPDDIQVVAHQRISVSEGGFSFGTPRAYGLGDRIEWFPNEIAGAGGLLATRFDDGFGTRGFFLLYIPPDFPITGLVRGGYPIGGFRAGVGASFLVQFGFASTIALLPDVNGDEIPDLLTTTFLRQFSPTQGEGYIFFMQDSDFDGLDDNLDNCVNDHNPLQVDGDGDGVGDVCDNCVEVANTTQDDFDSDGEGDVCEPVEIQLVTTGTPLSPSWDLYLQCGAFSVTDVNGAIVMPAGAGTPQTLSLSGTTIGTSSTSGPGLVAPQRDDAIYYSASGNGAPDNRLCTTLDPPVLLGTLTTGAIAGTQLAAAALTAEGVTGNLAEDVVGAIPVEEIRLVNGVPIPILALELGPAVTTASGTRWDVLLKNASDEFNRVAFGLIAPVGTDTTGMRWVGCESTAQPPGGRALVAGERSCNGGTGVGVTVNSAVSWTVGPQASPPAGQVEHTLYVVLEGNRPSQSTLDTLNPINAGQVFVLGTVELDGNPDLEPALTTDGVNFIDDVFNTGTSVTAFEEADFDTPDPSQAKLIGAFNPADDVDGDGVQDLADNCPFEPNAAQTNRGSFLDATDDSDFLGDACQCGEATDDGAVLDPDDFDEVFDLLAGKITNPIDVARIEARCSVAGTTDCNIRDLVVLRQAIDAGDPSVEVRCDAALSPAP